MKESSELFELCKEVYERTGWMPEKDQYLAVFDKNGNKSLWAFDNCYWRTFDDSEEDAGYVPLYTSDYLLEKLPRTIKDIMQYDDAYLMLYPKGGYWKADYIGGFIGQKSDTPLKALLKLTLALHKEVL